MDADKRRDAIRKMIAGHTAKLVAQGPEACRRYLIDGGFYREDGRLMPVYGGELDPGEKDPWLYMLVTSSEPKANGSPDSLPSNME